MGKVNRTQREVKIMFYWPNRDRDTWGSRITLPITWMKDMGISPEDRNVSMFYDEENKSITIKKI